MKDMSWESYRIFLDVARQGGLTGAAQASGLSPATVGRRVLQLEEAVGRVLFLRSQTGYRLTGEGQALYERLLAMEAIARGVESWRQEGQAMRGLEDMRTHRKNGYGRDGSRSAGGRVPHIRRLARHGPVSRSIAAIISSREPPWVCSTGRKRVPTCWRKAA